MSERPPLRAVIVEDEPDDLELLLRVLRRAFDLEHRWVDDEAGLRDAIAEGGWDVVLSDHGMPRFDSRAAHRVVRAEMPDVPFIVVSGTMGEHVAVDAMREGIDDYVVKSSLELVVPAIERAMERRRGAARSRAMARKNEAFMRAVLEQLPAALWTTDTALRIQSLDGSIAPRQFADDVLIGLTVDAAIQKLGGGVEELLEAHRGVLEGESARGFDVVIGGRVLTGQVTPMRDDGAITGTIGVAFDVTARRQLHEELRIARRLEALGRLSGGVAHDFNNILTVVLGHSSSLLAETVTVEVRHGLESIRQAAERAAALTQKLLAVGRQQVMRDEVVAVDRVVSEMHPLLARTMGDRVELVSTLPDRGCCVRGDRAQLEQVLLNLVVNARDAMPDGGRVEIEVARETRPDSETRLVRLTVSDEGIGIDDAIRQHLFEPFFTTKGDRGTGLGLATVHGIVSQLGGEVRVQSERGRGTRFDVCLPSTDREPSRRSDRPAAAAAVPEGTRVLLVEDDHAVRRAAERILRRHGCEIVSRASPATALRDLDPEVPIDILLTDVQMPEMSGTELADRLRALRPGLRAVFMSGHARDGIGEDGLLWSDATFLQKPFTNEQLVRALGEELARVEERGES